MKYNSSIPSSDYKNEQVYYLGSLTGQTYSGNNYAATIGSARSNYPNFSTKIFVLGSIYEAWQHPLHTLAFITISLQK